uniref:Uncharacterized protein n=1 Tax=Physcomitrium patens TaxID=3218 RepID=A0A2K1L1T6_PHYPA|nr:hypothetical protein PHYPA_002780 [Physcomitrium patens]
MDGRQSRKTQCNGNGMLVGALSRHSVSLHVCRLLLGFPRFEFRAWMTNSCN